MSIQQKLIAVLLSAREYQNQKSTQSSNTSANSVSVNSQMPLATVITELKALLTDINNPTIKIDPLKKDALLEHCKTLLDALSPKVSYEETPLLDVVTKTPGLRQ